MNFKTMNYSLFPMILVLNDKCACKTNVFQNLSFKKEILNFLLFINEIDF